jgi:hypothetical protein
MIKALFKLGARFFPEEDSSVMFWTDHRTGEDALSVRYPRLFQICLDPCLTLEHVYEGDGWRIFFRRTFGQDETNQWLLLVQELEEVVLAEGGDKEIWKFEQSDRFSVNSMYKLLSHGPTQALAKPIWKTTVPLKIKNFAWQLVRGKLP